MAGNFFQHLQALGNLATLEGREAAQRGLRVVIAVAAALFFAAFGYLLFFLFLAFLLERFFHLEWIWITLIFAVFHFLLALTAALVMRRQFSAPFFASTAAELRKDIELLKKEQP